jgi:hypothetical protein
MVGPSSHQTITHLLVVQAAQGSKITAGITLGQKAPISKKILSSS